MISLKNKMQMIMEDLDRYKSLYEKARVELEEEKKLRGQVCEVGVVFITHRCEPRPLKIVVIV